MVVQVQYEALGNSQVAVPDLLAAYAQGKEIKNRQKQYDLANRQGEMSLKKQEMELPYYKDQLENQKKQGEMAIEKYGRDKMMTWVEYAKNFIPRANTVQDLMGMLKGAEDYLDMDPEISKAVLSGIPESAINNPEEFAKVKESILYGAQLVEFNLKKSLLEQQNDLLVKRDQAKFTHDENMLEKDITAKKNLYGDYYSNRGSSGVANTWINPETGIEEPINVTIERMRSQRYRDIAQENNQTRELLADKNIESKYQLATMNNAFKGSMAEFDALTDLQKLAYTQAGERDIALMRINSAEKITDSKNMNDLQKQEKADASALQRLLVSKKSDFDRMITLEKARGMNAQDLENLRGMKEFKILEAEYGHRFTLEDFKNANAQQLTELKEKLAYNSASELSRQKSIQDMSLEDIKSLRDKDLVELKGAQALRNIQETNIRYINPETGQPWPGSSSSGYRSGAMTQNQAMTIAREMLQDDQTYFSAEPKEKMKMLLDTVSELAKNGMQIEGFNPSSTSTPKIVSYDKSTGRTTLSNGLTGTYDKNTKTFIPDK